MGGPHGGPLAPDDLAAVRAAVRAADGSRTWDELATDREVARGLALLHRHGAIVDGDDHAAGPGVGPGLRSILHRARLSRAALGDPNPGPTVAARTGKPVHVWGSLAHSRVLASVLRACGVDADRVHGPVAGEVVVAWGRPPWAQVSEWMVDGVVHFPVSPRVSSLRVGPLVVPGETACLQCLNLARTDRNGEWPRIAERLQRTPLPDPDPVVVHHAAALVARLLVDWLQDGSCAAVGSAWEVSLDRVEPRRIPVERHPLCGCWWPRPIGEG